MEKINFFLFPAVLSGLWPIFASAAEGGHKAHELNVLKEIVFPFLNFFLLLGILIYFLRRPLKEFLLARSKKVAQSIEQAAQEKQEAEAKALNYEKRLQNIDGEMKEMVASFKKEGELAREKIIEEAKIMSRRMEETARLIGNQEFLKVKERLKEEAVQLSAEWAERFLRENMKPQDRERIVQEAVKRLEAIA